METIHCQNCGSVLSSSEGCPKCGILRPYVPATLESSQECPSCSTPNRSGASFCFFCGKAIKDAKHVTQANSSVSPATYKLLQDVATKEINEFNKREGRMPAVAHMPNKVKKGQKRVGLWGPHASGKTAFMLSLYLASRQSGYEWLMSLKDVDDQARALFDGMAENLLNGDFPEPNPPEKGEPDIYNFTFYPESQDAKLEQTRTEKKDDLEVFWKQVKNWLVVESEQPGEKKEFPGIAISFADVAGERYLKEPSGSVLWDHLAGCHGLVCLIDPSDFNRQFQITNRLGGLLNQKISKEHPELLIEGGRYLPHYVSLCFTKVDRPEWKNFMDDPEGLIDELERRTRISIRRVLSTDFSPKRTKYNCVSSVGLQAVVEGNRIQNPETIQPYNIFAPLNEWIQKKK